MKKNIMNSIVVLSLSAFFTGSAFSTPIFCPQTFSSKTPTLVDGYQFHRGGPAPKVGWPFKRVEVQYPRPPYFGNKRVWVFCVYISKPLQSGTNLHYILKRNEKIINFSSGFGAIHEGTRKCKHNNPYYCSFEIGKK